MSLHPLCAIAAWAAFFYKIRALSRARDEVALRALCFVLGASALSFTVSLPAIWGELNRWSGIPGLAPLALQACVMSFAVGQQVLLAYWMEPPAGARKRLVRRFVLIGIAAVGMFGLFLLSVVGSHLSTAALAAGRPYRLACSLVYNVVYAAVETEVAILCLRYARVSYHWLRRGLVVAATGAVLTLSYSGIGIVDACVEYGHLSPVSWEDLVWTLGDAGALCKIIGWTIPGWGPRIWPVADWLRKYRQYRTLYPLWCAVHRAVPGVALQPDNSLMSRVLVLWGLEFKLYRRVIEIRDGILAVRHRVAAGVTRTALEQGCAAGLSGNDLLAVVQAAQLASALESYETGGRGEGDVMIDGPPRTSFQEELTWIVKLSEVFNRCPVVHEVTGNDSAVGEVPGTGSEKRATAGGR
ncbi:MAB_1171c family putative transporter [Streptomyces sp. NPDC002078]